MIVVCSACGKKYRLEDKHFKGKDEIHFACPNCKSTIHAIREGAGAGGADSAGPSRPATATRRIKKTERTWNADDLPDPELLALPDNKRLSLAVLQGASAGQIFPVEKPVVIMGRSDADIVLADAEVSRNHARIEVRGATILLRDLKSTNGTYVNEQRVTVTPIENQSEFRIGATTLMLIVTDAQE